MSPSVQDVLNEYMRLRINGLESAEAIRTLHPYVQDFDDAMRDELARNMRAWENQRTELVEEVDHESLQKSESTRNGDTTITCPHCGKENHPREQICYACGMLLATVDTTATDVLRVDDDVLQDGAYFSGSSVLFMTLEGTEETFTLRPQLGTGQLTLGRSNEMEAVDVDLERVGASRRGVSRVHATIIYNDASDTLSIVDMSSTNGTFINEQRLHSSERRTLRHGDRLRLGRLSFNVVFKHD